MLDAGCADRTVGSFVGCSFPVIIVEGVEVIDGLQAKHRREEDQEGAEKDCTNPSSRCGGRLSEGIVYEGSMLLKKDLVHEASTGSQSGIRHEVVGIMIPSEASKNGKEKKSAPCISSCVRCIDLNPNHYY